MADRGSTLKRWLATAATAAVASASQAQVQPDLTLRYQELSQREVLRFTTAGAGESAKSVGILNWEFPLTTFATVGFDQAPKTFCVEPMVPVVPGTEYTFTVESFGKPVHFAGVKDDADGQKTAERRTKFVRELYGRYYGDVLRDPTASGAAFQTAVWELVSETELPEGPMPFSLYTGAFQVAPANEAQAPEHVKTAQKYVQSLTGDDAVFAETPNLAGQELIRLTSVKNDAGVVGQSQLAVRMRGGVQNVFSPLGESR